MSYRNAYSREHVDALIARAQDSNSMRIVEICVEGKEDVKFYKRWVDSIDNLKPPKTEIVVKEIRNIAGSYPNINGSVGNCDLVVQIAQVDKDRNRLFIRDRDLLKNKDLVHRSNLFYTDYPAIESYPFVEKVFNLFNKDFYLSIHKDVNARYWYSLHFLISMYCLRVIDADNTCAVKREVQKLRNNYKSCFKDGYFCVEEYYKHTDIRVKNRVDDIFARIGKNEIDARKYIYSHDTEHILNFVFTTDTAFLNSHSAPSVKGRYIINWMLIKFIDEGLWKQEQMFQSIINRYILSER